MLRNKQMPQNPPLVPSSHSNSPFDPFYFHVSLSKRFSKLRLYKASDSTEHSPDSGDEANEHLRTLLEINHILNSVPFKNEVSSVNKTWCGRP